VEVRRAGLVSLLTSAQPVPEFHVEFRSCQPNKFPEIHVEIPSWQANKFLNFAQKF
ncbi:uncharacterized protein METZ01_LOCUS186780, partial [marine metagenome]